MSAPQTEWRRVLAQIEEAENHVHFPQMYTNYPERGWRCYYCWAEFGRFHPTTGEDAMSGRIAAEKAAHAARLAALEAYR